MVKRDLAHAEIVLHASSWMHAAEVRNSTFSLPHWSYLSRIQDHRILRPGSASAYELPIHWPILSFAEFHCLLYHVVTIHQHYMRHAIRYVTLKQSICSSNNVINLFYAVCWRSP